MPFVQRISAGRNVELEWAGQAVCQHEDKFPARGQKSKDAVVFANRALVNLDPLGVPRHVF